MHMFYLIAAVLVTIISAARITRVLVYDDFPPVAKPRAWFKVRTDSDWRLIAECGFCMLFWVTLGLVIWALLADVYSHPAPDYSTGTQVWWFVNGVFAASYLAASYIARDGDES
jgi:hypothetical protein